jgi:hypothetical protein
MEELSSRLAKLEKLEDPTVSQKSYDLLIEIKYLPEIPRDDEFYITKRVIQMLRRRGNGEKKCSISSRGQPSDGCSTKPSPGLNPQQQAKLSKSRTPETRVTGLIEERQSDTMTRPNPMSKLHCDPVFSHLPLPIIIDSSDESGDDTPASSKSSGTPFTTSSRALLSKAKKRTRRESTVSDSDIGSFDTFQERISPSTAAEIQAKRRKLTRPNTRRKPPIQGYLEHENIWINESRIFASKLFEQTERELEEAKMKKIRLAEERDRLTAEYNRMIRECESECDLIVTRRDNLNNFKGLLLGWGAQDEEVGAKLV